MGPPLQPRDQLPRLRDPHGHGDVQSREPARRAPDLREPGGDPRASPRHALSGAGPRVITLHGVTKRFGDRVALDHVSIDVLPATTHVLLGSSGSGKSTVLRLILGLVEPDDGTVLVDGTAVGPSTRAALVGRMGYVVQDGGLYPHLTAYQNVALGAEGQRWRRARIGRRVTELAVMAGVGADPLRRSPRDLSGDRKSTRLNSSHGYNSYAVFFFEKKKKKTQRI